MAQRALHPTRLLVFAGAIAALAAGCGSDEYGGSGGEREAERAVVKPVPSATVRVIGNRHGEDPITAVATGEGGVWVSGAGCLGSVSRIDLESNEVVAKIPVGVVVDVAVGEGAAWALAAVCPGSRYALFRIDPRTNDVGAKIPLDPSPGDRRAEITEHLAAGEGGVWVPVQSSASSGEIVRIDPRTNEVAARIPTRGAPGDIAVGAGAVWVLSHPELTDKATGAGVGSSLLRIDPRTNEVVATLAQGALAVPGGSLMPPLMAPGEGAVWVSGVGPSPDVFRVEASTNQVARERIDGDRFHPFAVAEGGVWLLGSTGQSATLERLNSQTLELDNIVEVGGGLDAAFHPASRSFWLAEERSVVRVDLR